MEHVVVSQIEQYGYLAVFVLMVLESACIPVPSEVVMLFGGALAGGLVVSGVHLSLNVIWVAVAGALGNLVGSLIAYGVGRSGGRRLIERWGRYVLLRREHLRRSEDFFARRGDVAVLVGRVVPVVRTFISLPAGVAEMPAGRFSVLTLVGCVPWTFGLAFAGQALASHWQRVAAAFTPISVAVGVLLAAALAWWIVQTVNDRRRGA